jgi:hypothetical protein
LKNNLYWEEINHALGQHLNIGLDFNMILSSQESPDGRICSVGFVW